MNLLSPLLDRKILKLDIKCNSLLRLILFFCFFLPIMTFAQSGHFPLTGTNMGPQNYINLQWDPSGLPSSSNYRFTLYQWDQSLTSWQTASTNYDKTIKVLNVYPGVGNNLKKWMETEGAGLGKILVTEVTIDNFNTNPGGYLKSGGEYQYDAIMFGSWDSNYGKDLNAASAAEVAAFLQTGRGVLFGHDTQYQGHPNFASLKDWTNLYIDPASSLSQHWRGSNQVKAVNDGYLLKYPHTIPYNAILNVPYCHSTGQFAKGVIWMDFPNTQGNGTTWIAPPTSMGGGTNNFYLTTWNNSAMIQTGHSGGAATTDEKNIIANTLWYLAQFTTSTAATVRSALDVAKPTIQNATRNSIDHTKINITAYDIGSAYKFYVEATSLTNNSIRYTSNELSIENKTGLKGYYISEDCSSTGTPNILGEPAILASDNQGVVYTVKHKANYVHIVAVDYAGNLSDVTTIEPALTLAQDFVLTCQGMGKENYIKLSWDPSTLDGLCGGGSGGYRYTIFQWDTALNDWQTTSASYGKIIKVLNVYPDISGSNTLKTWMETNGAGKGQIEVTPVSISSFNADPDGWLIDAGTYKYDVVMFGSWNVNNYKDINTAARDATEEFLKTGRGVLFGHDVPFKYDYPQVHTNFIYLAERYLNMDFSYIGTDGTATPGKIKTLGGTQVQAIRKGFLLEYPWTIGHNSILTIPHAHSSAQLAKGLVWMAFYNPAGQIVNDLGGTNNFYLTTWNNTAMIQTGHSNGAGTTDEQRIIANTLWYLAQFTTETTADMAAAQDKAAPDAPAVSRNSTNCGKLNLKTKDNGTTYKYYVQATDLSDSDYVKKSNETECTTTTGLKGYYIAETTSPTHVGDVTGTFISAADNEQVEYNVVDQSKYIHMQAVDHAGNRSTITTLESIPTFSYPAVTYCPVGTVTPTRTGPTGGTFTAVPTGLSINTTAGVIDLAASTPNTYVITYNYNTGCTLATATVTVNPLPVITIEDAVADEGANLTFKVKLTGGHCSTNNATVAYTAVNGTATAPADYTAASGTITFAPGETEKTITIATVGNDNLVEGDEIMYIDLSIPINCKLSNSGNMLRATGTIKDKTDGSIIVEKYKPTAADASEPSTDGSFRIRFAGVGVTCTKDVKVSFTLVGADDPTDYTILTNANVTETTAIIKRGFSDVEVPIKVNNNYIVQGDRALKIEITGILP